MPRRTPLLPPRHQPPPPQTNPTVTNIINFINHPPTHTTHSNQPKPATKARNGGQPGGVAACSQCGPRWQRARPFFPRHLLPLLRNSGRLRPRWRRKRRRRRRRRRSWEGEWVSPAPQVLFVEHHAGARASARTARQPGGGVPPDHGLALPRYAFTHPPTHPAHPTHPPPPNPPGIILFVLRPILIPFAVSLLFYYLLQPVVNTLNKVGTHPPTSSPPPLKGETHPSHPPHPSPPQPPAICCREIYAGISDLAHPLHDDEEGSVGGRFIARTVGGLRRRYVRLIHPPTHSFILSTFNESFIHSPPPPPHTHTHKTPIHLPIHSPIHFSPPPNQRRVRHRPFPRRRGGRQRRRRRRRRRRKRRRTNHLPPLHLHGGWFDLRHGRLESRPNAPLVVCNASHSPRHVYVLHPPTHLPTHAGCLQCWRYRLPCVSSLSSSI